MATIPKYSIQPQKGFNCHIELVRRIEMTSPILLVIFAIQFTKPLVVMLLV